MLRWSFMANGVFVRASVFGIFALIAGCSAVVEPVQLENVQSSGEAQEEFEINLKALTFDTARAMNTSRYERRVSRPGRDMDANVVSENAFANSSFPKFSERLPYRLGIGDEVTLIQYVSIDSNIFDLTGQNGSTNISPVRSSNVISTHGRIGTDGSVLLLGIGRLEARGREISELRDEVRGILIRNGSAPNFQLEVSEFNSQKAFISNQSSGGQVIPITDQGITLREQMASSGIAFDKSVLTTLRLQRGSKTYNISLTALFSPSAPQVYLRDQDHIFIQNLAYLPGKVFLLGGLTPKVIPVSPEERQTLADVLFVEGGPLATPTAQRSAVYLLRGDDPVTAYHLDAQNPARVLVAEALELRPADIVFVAEQPIITFNRTLATVTPLRILLRDIRDGQF